MQKLCIVVFVVVLAEDEAISHDSCWCGPCGVLVKSESAEMRDAGVLTGKKR